MNFKRLTSSAEVLDLIEHHNQRSKFVSLDVETTSTEPRHAKLLDIQLSGKNKDEAVIFSAEKAPLLANISKSLVIVAHNYKYDAHVLFKHQVDLLSHTWRDTLLIAHLLDENRESYSLDSFVKEYFNDDYKEEFWKKHKTYEEASPADAIEYACKDIVYTDRLFVRFNVDLERERIPSDLVTHAHRLQDSLLRTEIEGIRVDKEYLTDLGVGIKQRIDELAPKMRSSVEDEIAVCELQLWGEELSKRKTDKGRARVPRPTFNFESGKQLQRLLYKNMGLPEQRNAKTRAVSTDYESLQNIRSYHPVIELIQENRDLQKVYGTYIQGTVEKLEESDVDRINQPRIYPQFRVAGTVTGRLSHSQPNLAQLPKSGGVRGIYVPDRGRVLISADYSQLEVVIEANLTGDKNLIRMLENGESKHDLTARELGCDRDTAKTLNFAHQYWCSHYKTAKLLGVSVDEGLRVWTKYWQIYSGAKALKAKTDAMVDRGDPIVSVFGRKRRFEKKNRQGWDSDYRQAYNFLIQSTGADITSEAFYKVSERLRIIGKGRGLFTVHDEILIEVDEGFSEEANHRLKAIMTEFPCSKVPLKVESSGPMLRWED